MRADTGGRIFSWILMTLAVTFWISKRTASEFAMGKQAYLADRAHYFDTFLSHPRPLGLLVFVYAIMLGGCLLLYEFVARIVARMIVAQAPPPYPFQPTPPLL